MHRSIKVFIPILVACLVAVWVYAGSIVGTASLTVASPTATPTPGGLQGAMNQMLADATGATAGTVGGTAGISSPPATFCKSGGGATCTTPGSVTVGGGEAGAAITSALSTGDVSLPSGTYAVTSGITIPSQRALHCQNGASITLSGTASIAFSSGATYSYLVDCVINSTASTAPVVVNGGYSNGVVGNTISGPSGVVGISLTGSTAHNQIILNQLTGNTGITNLANNQVRLNEVSGSMHANNATTVAAIPMPTGLGTGLTLPTDLWAVLAILEPTTGNNGYVVPTWPGSGVDATSAIDTALTSASAGSGVLLTGPHVWLVPGQISGTAAIPLPTGVHLICEPGVQINFTINSSTGTNNPHLIDVGFYNGNQGQNMVLGCEIQGGSNLDPGSGPSSPSTSYANKYNNAFEVGGLGGSLPADILALGVDIHDIVGDGFITDVGTNSTTSGPTNVTLAFSHINHDQAQSAIHMNGGQYVSYFFNNLSNGLFAFEADSGVLQVQIGNFNHNYISETQNHVCQDCSAPDLCAGPYNTCTAQSTVSGMVCNYGNNKVDGDNLSCGPPMIGGSAGSYVNSILVGGALSGTNLYPGLPCLPCAGTYSWGG